MSELSEEMRNKIDSMSYETMLRKCRFAPAGDPLFQHGEVGDYFSERMKELRAKPGGQERHVAASKAIGWD